MVNMIRKKIITTIDLGEFKIVDEASDAIYLNEEEINYPHQRWGFKMEIIP